MAISEEDLAEIQARLQKTQGDFRELIDEIERLHAEVLGLRAAILKHARAGEPSSRDLTPKDRELYAALLIMPRTEAVRKALVAVEAARKLVKAGREGEELNRRALSLAVQEYDDALQNKAAEPPRVNRLKAV